MVYKVDTDPAIIHSPVAGSLTKQDLNLTYTLEEDMLTDSVWLLFEFISGTAGTPSANGDPDAPHEIPRNTRVAARPRSGRRFAPHVLAAQGRPPAGAPQSTPRRVIRSSAADPVARRERKVEHFHFQFHFTLHRS